MRGFDILPKVILDLCGGTGSWSKPYREAGYDVKIIDINEDVRLFEKPHYKVHGILAAPPCTHLAVSGALHWNRKGISALLEALSVVDACLRAISITNPKWWCLENPIGRLNRYLGDPVMYFNPCDFGDPYTKKTCLWGKFNIPKFNRVFPSEGSRMHLLPPSENRQMLRSITPEGFAKAFFNANP